MKLEVAMFRFSAQLFDPAVGTRPHADAATAVVVGGGIAGVSAACVLAERGVRVTLVERNGFLGGRAGAWTERHADGEPFEMERGFHAFFRQYYNLRALLRRVDPDLRNLIALEDYPLYGPGGAAESFAGLPRQPPFNVAALVKRTPRLRLADLVKVDVGAAMEMLAYDGRLTARLFDAMTARDYLDALRFPADARQMLFEVFAHSFFNPEEGMSAADLLMMFHFYFTGNPEGLVFDVLGEPFSLALWHPLRRHLEAHGVTVRLGESVRRLARRGASWDVFLADAAQPLGADAVVLATDLAGVRRIVADSPDLDAAEWRARVGELQPTLPFAVWRLWLDRPVLAQRPAFAGTSGFGLLDNVSVYERFEGESRRWAMRHGGSVLELHAYAVPQALAPEAIRRELLAQVQALYPEVRSAKIVADRFLLEQDCPAFAPGSAERRLAVETPFDGLALAGDYLALPFPSALMERAAASGFLAANRLLRRWDVRGEPVWSVPTRGLFASVWSALARAPRGGAPAVGGVGHGHRAAA